MISKAILCSYLRVFYFFLDKIIKVCLTEVAGGDVKVRVPLTQVTRLTDRWGATGPRFARVCYTPGRRAVPLSCCSAG